MEKFSNAYLGFRIFQSKRSRRVFGTVLISTFFYVTFEVNKFHSVRVGNPAGITEFKKFRVLWIIFGRTRSRWFGWMMERQLPSSFRVRALTSFASVLGIDLSEARYPLQSYKSFGHLFARTLKDNCRIIEKEDDPDSLVIPCDGEVVNIAEIDFNQERLTQLADTIGNEPLIPNIFRRKKKDSQQVIGPIKGATFKLESFLGFDPRFQSKKVEENSAAQMSATESTLRLLRGEEVEPPVTFSVTPNRKFCYVIIYLAPHNYHHFHSPCDLGIQMRRHMPGMVFPVFKGLAKKFNDLFPVNERIVLSGRWKYGQMHYSAVAAYNVGNIRLKYEPNFRSNNLRTQYYSQHRIMESMSYLNPPFDEDFIHPSEKKIGVEGQQETVKAVWVSKGERLGEFRLGSTIVMVFEVPDSFQFDVNVGDKVKMGQLLGHVE